MSGGPLTVPTGSTATGKPSRSEVLLLLHALTAGVLWWAFHLVMLSVLTPAVCGGLPHWTMTAVNVVAAAGVVGALYTSFLVIRTAPPAAAITDRNRFLGYIAVLFNVASLALVVLESVPVYILDPCR